MDALELESAEKRAKMQSLMSNPEFRELILEDYIRNQAIDVGTTFGGNDDEVRTLASISDLNMYIQNILVDVL